MKEYKERLTTAKVARYLNKSDEFVRYGLIKGILPFGIAQKLPNRKRYSYYINPKLFYSYLGGRPNEILNENHLDDTEKVL